MNINWTYGGIGSFPGSVNPAWTETCVCEECGLNSRMRALFDLLNIQCEINSNLRIYIAEQTTPFFQKLKHKFPSLMGSEYLGADRKCGKILINNENNDNIRHEDITKLSFADEMFDIAITQEVFEHIPNYHQAFSELWRVISFGGSLVFSIPFFFDLEKTRIRASFENGNVVHYFPPEIHGNPISNEGSLCFQNFGWDILSDLRKAGFSDAYASIYWGPWQGHLGFPFAIFSAKKSEIKL